MGDLQGDGTEEWKKTRAYATAFFKDLAFFVYTFLGTILATGSLGALIQGTAPVLLAIAGVVVTNFVTGLYGVAPQGLGKFFSFSSAKRMPKDSAITLKNDYGLVNKQGELLIFRKEVYSFLSA